MLTDRNPVGYVNFIIASPFPNYSGGIENWLYHALIYFEDKGIKSRVFAYAGEGGSFYSLNMLSNATVIPVFTKTPEGRLMRWFYNISPASVRFCLDVTRYTYNASKLLLRFKNDGSTYVALHTFPACLPLVVARLFGLQGRTICFVRGKVGDDLLEGYFGTGWHLRILSVGYEFIEKIILKSVHEVISNGCDTSEYLQRQYRIKTKVFPNGVDYVRFTTPPLAECKSLELVRQLRDNDRSIIVTVGTLRDVKGIRYLLEAGSILKHQEGKSRFTMVFVGKGDPVRYQKLAADFGITDSVFFAGEQSCVPSFLALADVLVAVSGGGGVSNAAVEMMCSGKAIVAWDNLTYSQLITNNFSGYLVAERDSRALAKGIAYAIENRSLSAIVGRNAQEIAKNYDWDNVLDRFRSYLSLSADNVYRSDVKNIR